jgi:ribosomal protein S18 acetylase RimI-like enzyme
MAAATDFGIPRLIELRHLRADDLGHLLEEEITAWRESLDWDFYASAGLVRRFLDMQALNGYSLLMNGQPIGYSYYVCEERKGLIGDLYVLKQFANIENEGRLLNAVIDSLTKTPMIHRVESQLMMLRNGGRLPLPQWRYLRVFNRDFMEASLHDAQRFPAGKASRFTIFDNWTERRQDEAGSLIATAYQGHVDSEINDQYRSANGARRFLNNIVQYPGCGSFFQPASFVSLDSATGRLSGISLCSLVSTDVGHITQICVSKAVRGTGVGYELLRRSMVALAQHNCKKASLTVTTSNLEAIELYKRTGFEKIRDFAALVWDGF